MLMPDYPVQIQVDSIILEGDLTIPLNSQSIVLFAPGSGSNRFSTRNQLVAQTLSRSNISTLLVDLLTPSEAAIDQQTRQIGFDIPLLTRRLTALYPSPWQLEQENNNCEARTGTPIRRSPLDNLSKYSGVSKLIGFNAGSLFSLNIIFISLVIEGH